jgi:FkbM family methyltransferase
VKDFRIPFRSVWNNPGNIGRRGRRLFDALSWQLQKRISSRPRIIKLANGVLFKAYPDCAVSSALIYADWPEFHELQFIRRRLRSDDAVVDVGANVGHVSLLLADLVDPRNIFAFEPTPVSFYRLVENWKANGWTTEHLFQKAVGRSAGTARIPNTASPETKNAIVSVNGLVTSVEVLLISLDDCRSCWSGSRVGLLKIDVEGFEQEIFLGALQLLNEDRPRLIMFESLRGHLEKKIGAILNAARYSVFQLDECGRPDFVRAAGQNLFAVPQEDAGSIH